MKCKKCGIKLAYIEKEKGQCVICPRDQEVSIPEGFPITNLFISKDQEIGHLKCNLKVAVEALEKIKKYGLDATRLINGDHDFCTCESIRALKEITAQGKRRNDNKRKL